MKREHEIIKNFIVLEGIDGAGTTTQLNKLSAGLEQAKTPYHRTFEPTDYTIGKLIRQLLKGGETVEPGTMAHLFAADRFEHIYHRESGIKFRAENGEIVICDRYLFSSLAYQSIECGFNFVYSLNEHFPLPEYLVFLDVPVEVSQQRLAGREFLEIYEHNNFQEQVYTGYQRALAFFAGSPMTLIRIDGTLPPEEIYQKICNSIPLLPMI